MPDIVSLVIDIPLMHTIAQASATFIAILAGFYTAKVLSISSDKERIRRRIKEVKREIDNKRTDIRNLANEINSIQNKWDEERVDYFTEHIATTLSSVGKINNLNDLKQYFRNFFNLPSSENEERILADKYQSIIEAINERKDSDITMLPHYSSEAEQNYNNLQRINEQNNRDRLNDMLKREESKIDLLEILHRDLQREFEYLEFPKYIRFGFASFLIFAILGVIFPLTYNLWGSYLIIHRDIIDLIYYSDIFALLLFGIGLALTFSYIGLELRHALLVKPND
jgi:hypothetical protein